MAGWGNFPVKGAAPLSGVEPLINAVNERSVAVGLSPVAQFTKLYEFDGLTTIQNRISSLITQFVNHLDSGGVWTGKTEIPNWTEADILSEIGESRLPVPGSVYELSTTWLEQQKKIINLLLWTQTNSQTYVNGSGFNGASTLDLFTIQEAVDIAIANIQPFFTDIGNYTSVGKVNNRHRGTATAGKGSINFSALNGSVFQSSADVYFLAGNNRGTFEYLRVFDGAGIAIEGLNYITALSSDNRSSYITPVIGDDSIFPTYPPGPLDNTWNSSIGWYVFNSFFISKFNVTGGFEYV